MGRQKQGDSSRGARSLGRRLARGGAVAIALGLCAIAFGGLTPTVVAASESTVSWPANLPVYDHIVIVVEENKDYDEIIGNKDAEFINELAAEGASFTRMFGEEHNSQGNYFWLFSGSNQGVGFKDKIPTRSLATSNLGQQLIKKGLSFKGYSQSLPAVGSTVEKLPSGCGYPCVYGRKHVPWISFKNVPNGTSPETSSNLRFADFPADFSRLPTVAFVIPDLDHDMHNVDDADPAASFPKSIRTGDGWLRENLGPYYQWAKTHNSLLIVTFDESNDKSGVLGLTNPSATPDHDQRQLDLQNRIATVIAGDHVKPHYVEAQAMTHVNILRTIEAMYGLPKSGAQQVNAMHAGISDDRIETDAFQTVR